MKKYGVRFALDHRILYYACCNWEQYIDEDGRFGVDDLNVAYKFRAHHNLRAEVFEKEINK